MKIKSINSKQFKTRCAACLVALLALSMLSGCGGSDMESLCLPRDVSHTGVDRDTAEVERGDLSPVYENIIELAGYEETSYRVEKDKAEELDTLYEAKLDKVYVSVGDRVKAGDTLVSFKSESLSKELREYENEKSEASLEKEHYEKLMQIDSSLDYKDEIASLEKDIELANTHIQDINDTYDSINIIAEKDGVVKFINQSVQDGFLVVGAPMITVADDAGYYVMDFSGGGDSSTAGDAKMVTTDVEFHVGDICPAKTFLSEYKVEVIEDPTKYGTETDAVASGTDAVSNGKVYFKLVGDSAIKENFLTVSMELPEIKGALYVDKKAVIFTDTQDYAYKQIDGEFFATKVTVGDNVGQYIIIKEGLEEGDVVSVSD